MGAILVEALILSTKRSFWDALILLSVPAQWPQIPFDPNNQAQTCPLRHL